MKRENRIERFSTHWQQNFMNEPYYSSRYTWEDFDPAYRYAYKSYEENPNTRFEDVEERLEAGWDIAKGKSQAGLGGCQAGDAFGLEQRRARPARRLGPRRPVMGTFLVS